MEKLKKEKSFDLYSKDEELSKKIDVFKKNQKLYAKIISVLKLLGNFTNQIEVFIYEIVDKEECNSVKLCCNDLDDNIFLFFLSSSSKEDTTKIYKETNKGTLYYDVSLAKKYELNEENIEFIRTSIVNNFKFGRLITDNNSFYSIMLGNDIGYQIKVEFIGENTILSNDLLQHLNQFAEVPTFVQITNVFELLLLEKELDFSILTMSAYKNLKRIGYISFNGNQLNNTSNIEKIKRK